MEIAGDETMKRNQLLSGIRVLCAVGVIFGTIPALATLAEEPAAMATTLYAEEPPQPPELSDEERQALADKKAGTLEPKQEKALRESNRQPRSTRTNATSRNNEERRAGDEFPKRKDRYDDDFRTHDRWGFAVKSQSGL
jgi:hypothetical protein